MQCKLAKYIGLKTKIFFLLFGSFSLFSNEGLFAHKSVAESFDVMAHFLPLNPVILLLGAPKSAYDTCKNTWPLGEVFDSVETCLQNGRKIDFLWVDGTPQIGIYFLKNLIGLFDTNSGTSPTYMSFCTRWDHGTFFLKNEVYQGFVTSINFTPAQKTDPIGSFRTSMVMQYLKPIQNKPPPVLIPSIDSIYLINLDERVEKFSASLKQLQPFGIIPYRFSAINGWDLSVHVLNELGLRLTSSLSFGTIMGKVYREIEGREYKNIEFIKDPTLTYFCTGITRGAIGCLLSHLSVLKSAYESGYETIWVMEDDIQILQNPLELSSLIEELDQIDRDWDILFTDPDMRGPQGDFIPCRALAVRPDISIYPLADYQAKCKRIHPHFSQTGMRYGTHSMILRKLGIQKILQFYQTHGLFLPYDCDIWLIPEIKMYCLNQEMTSAHHFFSDNGAPNYIPL
jgi:GR25 family glycosyltransferase involved in LPS biosynthesis